MSVLNDLMKSALKIFRAIQSLDQSLLPKTGLLSALPKSQLGLPSYLVFLG